MIRRKSFTVGFVAVRITGHFDPCINCLTDLRNPCLNWEDYSLIENSKIGTFSAFIE